MGLDVQVLPAHGAEARAVLAAEDLLGELERDGVTCPGAELEVVVRDVVGVQLVGSRRVEVVELARANAGHDLCEAEAAHAGARQVRLELHVEYGRAGGL